MNVHVGDKGMAEEFDFGVPYADDGMNRREFCSAIAAVAVAGSSGMVGSAMGRPSDERPVAQTANAPIDKTSHKMFFEAAQKMGRLKNSSVDLVVTSPPYPMIAMWDGVFAAQSKGVKENLGRDPNTVFEFMHMELDKVWSECHRVLKDGGFMCINIGDATRTINKDFRLYNNHARVVSACLDLGFANLPNIIWRKQTNAPNKFMGSGMLPCGAYVTLEHEWILVFRKGGKRIYKSEQEKTLRRRSAFFWEERNQWFSDVWEIKGTRQAIANSLTRERNASFPLEIPLRLVNMYSQFGDVVLDPFMGMGTTMVAAMLSGRNSVGFEIDKALKPSIADFIGNMGADAMRRLVRERIKRHLSFVEEREVAGKEVKYWNRSLDCKVMTSQETDIELAWPDEIRGSVSGDFCHYCSYRSK